MSLLFLTIFSSITIYISSSFSILNIFVLGMVLGKEFFESRPALCDVAATVCLTVCVTALLSIGGMSINRYFFICQGAFYRKHFTLRINILICLICWAAGMYKYYYYIISVITYIFDDLLLLLNIKKTSRNNSY